MGVTNPLVRDEETRLLLSWLVMADAVAVAIIKIDFSLLHSEKNPNQADPGRNITKGNVVSELEKNIFSLQNCGS